MAKRFRQKGYGFILAKTKTEAIKDAKSKGDDVIISSFRVNQKQTRKYRSGTLHGRTYGKKEGWKYYSYTFYVNTE